MKFYGELTWTRKKTTVPNASFFSNYFRSSAGRSGGRSSYSSSCKLFLALLTLNEDAMTDVVSGASVTYAAYVRFLKWFLRSKRRRRISLPNQNFFKRKCGQLKLHVEEAACSSKLESTFIWVLHAKCDIRGYNTKKWSTTLTIYNLPSWFCSLRMAL